MYLRNSAGSECIDIEDWIDDDSDIRNAYMNAFYVEDDKYYPVQSLSRLYYSIILIFDSLWRLKLGILYLLPIFVVIKPALIITIF